MFQLTRLTHADPKLTSGAATFGKMFRSMSEAEIEAGIALAARCAPGAAITPDAWAHASCDTRHKGCAGVGFSIIERAGAATKIKEAKKEREAYMNKLLKESDREGGEKEEEKEWSYDKAGKKGPKTEYAYSVGGCVQAV